MLANFSTWAVERPVASASLARAEGVVLGGEQGVGVLDAGFAELLAGDFADTFDVFDLGIRHPAASCGR